MPAKPIAPETLQLIDAVRNALPDSAEVEEKTMFGCHVFMVNGKMCLGVENDELLVRLPPAGHALIAEMPGVRPLSSRGLMDGYFLVGPTAYAKREQWQYWIHEALAFNPQAKASPRRKKASATEKDSIQRTSSKRRSTKPLEVSDAAETPKKHPIFDSD
ncbi:TfoX/Sxy family protein [Comamonas sp. 26]|uniref:TfoX/Sxy family protein n=1 Tax=Comamonas sp. 26 TaxID=2035201 RepID=UPI000C18FDFE|nr:TfoX/Sxy family protein [Comamonas sp. 26]PIG08659.1 TfoX-like protein [Comamonas sp. 26]